MTSSLGRSREPTIRSEINVTPLVDVCLVLLIIFMVVTPMLTGGGDIALPETAAPRRASATILRNL
jgi:biopolymer transport protein ExbD